MWRRGISEQHRNEVAHPVALQKHTSPRRTNGGLALILLWWVRAASKAAAARGGLGRGGVAALAAVRVVLRALCAVPAVGAPLARGLGGALGVGSTGSAARPGRAFDAIVVETTGVAQPGPIIQLFFADAQVPCRPARAEG